MSAVLTSSADPTAAMFAALRSTAAFYAVRLVEEDSETLAVRKGVPQPYARRIDRGAMVTVISEGAYGYAATSDISVAGLQRALDQATAWAEASQGQSVLQFPTPRDDAPHGQYHSPHQRALPPRHELFALVAAVDAAAQIDPRIVDSFASIEINNAAHRYLTSRGGDVTQTYRFVLPNIQVTASDGNDTQTRSLAGQYNGFCQQGGAEVLDRSEFPISGARIAREAIELLEAPNCPSGEMDLLLMPDQMMLQIHESIGHPLELDRILGDERNMAGTSFVTLDMFGHYQYGSPLLNVTFDPTRPAEFASYAFDDEGGKATRELLIREGILVRPLGGALSQARARHLLGAESDFGGVSNSRAASWNRAPIDRMANLNIEPGHSSLDELIASVEYGVMMKTNVSWSIDDSRNKFQFGCEWGRMIEDGKLTRIVKNPNYRGVSATFWRSLKGVGDESTLAVMGTPFCGKGEPNQVIRVGHASPACLFAEVDVFGAEGRVSAQPDTVLRPGPARVDAENYFADLAKGLPGFMQGTETFTCSYDAEQSDFVRFNHAHIRQAGHVDQAYVSLRLMDGKGGADGSGQRQASISLTLSGDLASDLEHCGRALASLRSVLPEMPVDPLFMVETEGFTSRNVRMGRLPDGATMAGDVTRLGVGHDLVGFLASGPIFRGFTSSYGHHNWHAVSNFNFEWSLYYETDKAAKSSYAGFEWDAESLRSRIIRAANDVALLRLPQRNIEPGTFRVYLAPAAMSELVSMMAWGGFSAKARATHTSPLQKLYERHSTLSPLVTMNEYTAGGLMPLVQSDGYRRPDRVKLIEKGRGTGLLASPRTAREYSVPQNGAENDNEAPQSLDMDGGTLDNDQALRELGTGLCINNLWYLNFSDRMNARVTGMTRFATFWVENGEAVAPVNVMRFDDSLYRVLGDKLAALTTTREFIPDSGTYQSRLGRSMRLPGAIVNDFRFTL